MKIDNETIKKILLKNYEIEPIEINEINRGTADILKVDTEKKSYVMKIFTEGRTKESVIKETKIINYLRNKDIKVPIYIKAKSNDYYVEKNNRIIVLQEYIDGYTMENNTGNYEKVIESANLLGKMTKALSDYEGLNEEGIIEKNFSKQTIQNGIEKMKKLQMDLKEDNPYKQQFHEDLKFKIKVAEEIERNFDFDIVNKITVINSHGDYSVQQLIYNDKEGTTIIDFETAKKMPIVWEIMRSYSYVDKEAKDGILNIDTLVDYFKEFEKYIKLNTYDLKYAPHLYLIQLIASVFRLQTV